MAAVVRRALDRGWCLTHGLARVGLHGTALRSLLFITALSGLVRLPAATEAKECEKPCLNGQCNTASGVCVCEPGWVGEQCQHCGGRFRWDTNGFYSQLMPVTWTRTRLMREVRSEHAVTVDRARLMRVMKAHVKEFWRYNLPLFVIRCSVTVLRNCSLTGWRV